MTLAFYDYIVYTAGVGASARQPDAAKALIQHLTAIVTQHYATLTDGLSSDLGAFSGSGLVRSL